MEYLFFGQFFLFVITVLSLFFLSIIGFILVEKKGSYESIEKYIKYFVWGFFIQGTGLVASILIAIF